MTIIISIDINADAYHHCQGNFGSNLLQRSCCVRLTKEQAEHNRLVILETASQMFRLRGVENVSVGDIMKESGFTHGGFYNHFESKEKLAAEAVACSFAKSASSLSEKFANRKNPQRGLALVIAEYLSPAYRDTRTGGCPAAALPVDAARNGPEVQAAFAAGIESYLEVFAAQMVGNKQEVRQQAITLLSGLVGALVLSRATKGADPKLSDELLSSARIMLTDNEAEKLRN
jgi:TetR/AcrR family transcriptional regulator, transcriptional repressor for nem operon